MRNDFHMGEWKVMPRRECIRCGSGQTHIHPKPMAVLEHLAAARGEVVTREELFDAVWPGAEVTDDALTQCVVELRKAFGDCARHPSVIETIPKVGFRVIPKVRFAGDSERSPGAIPQGNWFENFRLVRIPRPWYVIFAACLLLAIVFGLWPGTQSRTAVQPLLSIAVLPFANLTGQQDQDQVADGLAVELTEALSRYPGLNVPDWTDSSEFRTRNADPRIVAARLGVAYLLEGSVRRNGDHLRVKTQLVDASSALPLWSGSFDWSPDAPGLIQEEMAGEILLALEKHLDLELR